MPTSFGGALIDGDWTTGDGLATISVLDPSNGQTIGQISGEHHNAYLGFFSAFGVSQIFLA